MNNNKWYKKPEMIVAFSALFISLVTTVVGIYSAYIDRTYARASVWPTLEIFINYDDEMFNYQVVNNGNGPALIKYSVVQYKSKPIKYWKDIPKFSEIVQSHLSTRILSSQTSVYPLSYKGEAPEAFLKANEFIKIELCYCSIYDECWLVDKANSPKAVDSCLVDQATAFLQ